MRNFLYIFLILVTVIQIHADSTVSGDTTGTTNATTSEPPQWKNAPQRSTTKFLVTINEYLKASLQKYTIKWRYRCPGTLFTARFVMTAAQCCFQLKPETNEPEFEYRPAQLKIRAGIVNMYSTSVDRKVKTVLANRGFNKDFDSDICIIELEQTYMRTKLINIMPHNNVEAVTGDSKCYGASYQFYNCYERAFYLDKPSYTQIYTKIAIKGVQSCFNRTNITEEELERRICTYTEPNSTFICPENMGSALICGGRLAGVASQSRFILKAGNQTNNVTIELSMYTDVHSFKDWIQTILPEQSIGYHHFPNRVIIIVLAMFVMCVSALV